MGVSPKRDSRPRGSQPARGAEPTPPQKTRDALQVIVTRECAYSCKYCQVDTRHESMTPETLAGAVDLLLASVSHDLNLLFMGGDPVMRFDLVRRAVARAEELAAARGKRVLYSLATTGFNLDEEMLRAFPLDRLDVNLNVDSLRPRRTRPWRLDRRPTRLRAAAVQRLQLLDRLGVPYCVGLEVEPTDVEGLSADARALGAAGARRVQALFRLGVAWPAAAAAKLLHEVESLLHAPDAPPLFNALAPMDPLLLHDDVVADCDGTLYWWAPMFIERGFRELKSACRIGRIGEFAKLDEISGSPAAIRRILLQTYPRGSRQAKILRNNLDLGAQLSRLCGHADWTAPDAAPTMTVRPTSPRSPDAPPAPAAPAAPAHTLFVCSTNAGCPINLPYLVQLNNYVRANEWAFGDVETADTIIISNCGSWPPYRKSVPATVQYLATHYPSKRIVVTCCYVKKDMVHAPNVSYVQFHDRDQFDAMLSARVPLEAVASGSTPGDDARVRVLSDPRVKLGLPYNIVVSTGCLNHCAFCNQKNIFPKLKSRTLAEVVAECREGLAKGYTHFVIGASDLASYGRDLDLDVTDLFEALFRDVLRQTPGLVVGLWAMEPAGLLRHFEQLEPYFAEDRISWMRMPVQSGSDSVLRSMNRHYRVADVVRVIRELRRLAPRLKIDTDLMFCYPTETRADFEASLRLAEEFDEASMLVFGRHDGTRAYTLEDVFDAEEKARRCAIIAAIPKKDTRELDDGHTQGHGVIEVQLPSMLGPFGYFVLCDTPGLAQAAPAAAVRAAAALPDSDPEVARLRRVERALSGKQIEMRWTGPQLDLVFPDDAQPGGESRITLARVGPDGRCFKRSGDIGISYAGDQLTPRATRVIKAVLQVLQQTGR
jgi:tRNA A37 methylthiotransferase MiaB